MSARQTVRFTLCVTVFWLSPWMRGASLHAAERQPMDHPQPAAARVKWEDDTDDITLYVHSIGVPFIPAAAAVVVAAFIGSCFYLRKRPRENGSETLRS